MEIITLQNLIDSINDDKLSKSQFLVVIKVTWKRIGQ